MFSQCKMTELEVQDNRKCILQQMEFKSKVLSITGTSVPIKFVAMTSCLIMAMLVWSALVYYLCSMHVTKP